MNNEIKEIMKQMESIAITGKNKNGIKVDGYGLQQNELKMFLDYINNLQQAFERSYTEEQLDFAVNEVKEQLKIEKQYSNQLCNEIDKLRVKNYELQQLEQEHQRINGELRERIAYLERSNDRREDTILGLRQEINDVEDKNSKLEIALQNIQEDYDRRIKEIDVLKDELKWWQLQCDDLEMQAGVDYE